MTARDDLTGLLADHWYEGLGMGSCEGKGSCECGAEFATADEWAAHLAGLLCARFLVVPLSDIQGTEYGWRYTHPDGVRTYSTEGRAEAVEEASYQQRLERDEEVPVTAEALERLVPPWSVIPLPEGGEKP